MSFSINPTQKDPERAFALQKYLLLHSQHDALQRNLQAIITSMPTTTADTSPEHSPSSRYRRRSSSSQSISPPASPDAPSTYTYVAPDNAPNNDARSQRRASVTQQHPHPRPPVPPRRSSLPTIVDDERTIGEMEMEEIEEEEMKLKIVNQQIKGTLTDLLNCESVRGDRRYRMWVQSRLMDAERELKRERSRCCGKAAAGAGAGLGG